MSDDDLYVSKSFNAMGKTTSIWDKFNKKIKRGKIEKKETDINQGIQTERTKYIMKDVTIQYHWD